MYIGIKVACNQDRAFRLRCNFASNGLKDFISESCLSFDFVAIGEAVNAVGAEDPTGFRAAKPNVNDPASFAEIGKSLYTVSANGAYSPSKVGEVGVNLAGN